MQRHKGLSRLASTHSWHSSFVVHVIEGRLENSDFVVGPYCGGTTNHRHPCPVRKAVSGMLLTEAYALRLLGNDTPHRGREILTKRENASLNSETCSSVRESACDVLLTHYLESCQRAGAVLISKAGYGSGRAARGSHTMLIVWGGLAEEERSRAENNRQMRAGYCGGIYRPGVVCEGGLAVFAAGELVELGCQIGT